MCTIPPSSRDIHVKNGLGNENRQKCSVVQRDREDRDKTDFQSFNQPTPYSDVPGA